MGGRHGVSRSQLQRRQLLRRDGLLVGLALGPVNVGDKALGAVVKAQQAQHGSRLFDVHNQVVAFQADAHILDKLARVFVNHAVLPSGDGLDLLGRVFLNRHFFAADHFADNKMGMLGHGKYLSPTICKATIAKKNRRRPTRQLRDQRPGRRRRKNAQSAVAPQRRKLRRQACLCGKPKIREKRNQTKEKGNTKQAMARAKLNPARRQTPAKRALAAGAAKRQSGANAGLSPKPQD